MNAACGWKLIFERGRCHTVPENEKFYRLYTKKPRIEVKLMPEQLKIFPSELEILKPLWEQGDLTAAQLWILVTERTGWHRNTIYTVINRCVKKGFITRIEPNFVCCPRITKKQAQEAATRILMKDFYDSDPFALTLNAGKNYPSKLIFDDNASRFHDRC